MNNLKTNLLYLPMISVLLATALARPMAAEQPLPFHGSLPGSETTEVLDPLLFVNGSGGGNITHLGRVTASWDRVGLLTDGTLTASYHFISANGDSLFVESIGQADLEMAPDIHVVEIGTITGGTGRFEGATGSLRIERIVVLTGPDTDTTSQSFDGVIVLLHGS